MSLHTIRQVHLATLVTSRACSSVDTPQDSGSIESTWYLWTTTLWNLITRSQVARCRSHSSRGSVWLWCSRRGPSTWSSETTGKWTSSFVISFKLSTPPMDEREQQTSTSKLQSYTRFSVVKRDSTSGRTLSEIRYWRQVRSPLTKNSKRNLKSNTWVTRRRNKSDMKKRRKFTDRPCSNTR